MLEKAPASDFDARFREIVSDPLNLLIRRVPAAGGIVDNCVVLHNGLRVPLDGAGAYYDSFSRILQINRGVHEPLEEFVFQSVLQVMPQAPVMLELGAYWGHYSMWMAQQRPAAVLHLVEPEPENLEAGRANFRRNGFSGTFLQALVGAQAFGVDRYLAETGIERLDVLHSDIQGAEAEMLEGAQQSLARRTIDRVFVSTHSGPLHLECEERLRSAGYVIEVSSDFDTHTTSFDGFIMASSPMVPTVFTPRPTILGRQEIATLEPDDVLRALAKISQSLRVSGDD